tara:strand:+ start:1875 stop:2222 length:348 start_codon:yes stop_codon:yes gene_type:complete
MAKYYEKKHSLIGIEKVLSVQKWYENYDCPDPNNGEEDEWNDYIFGVHNSWWDYNKSNPLLKSIIMGELGHNYDFKYYHDNELYLWYCENTYTNLIICSQLGDFREPSWEKKKTN